MGETSIFSITKLKAKKAKEMGIPMISEENAKKIILEACVEFDVDIDAEKDRKKRKEREAMLFAVLDYVQRGIIEINTSTWVIKQNLQCDYSKPGDAEDKKRIKFFEYQPITGKAKTAMDGKDSDDRYEMIYSILGELSGVGADAIQRLGKIDVKVAETLTLFFL